MLFRNDNFFIIFLFLATELKIIPLNIDKKLRMISALAKMAVGKRGTKPVSINSIIIGNPNNKPIIANIPPIVPNTNLG